MPWQLQSALPMENMWEHRILDFELLEKIYNEVEIPLVLHGGSGSGDENLARATRMGIMKVNIGNRPVPGGD